MRKNPYLKEGRRGEKVPAAVGTVANRLVESELAALDGQGSVLVADGTKVAAVGAGLFGSQRLRLLLHKRGKGAFGQAASGSGGDLLHRLEIDRLVGARLTEDAAGDDFSPSSG